MLPKGSEDLHFTTKEHGGRALCQRARNVLDLNETGKETLVLPKGKASILPKGQGPPACCQKARKLCMLAKGREALCVAKRQGGPVCCETTRRPCIVKEDLHFAKNEHGGRALCQMGKEHLGF